MVCWVAPAASGVIHYFSVPQNLPAQAHLRVSRSFEETGTYFSGSRVSSELLQSPLVSGSSLVLLSCAEWTFDGGCPTSEVREPSRN